MNLENRVVGKGEGKVMAPGSSNVKELLHRVRGSSIEFHLGPYRKVLAEINRSGWPPGRRQFRWIGSGTSS